jgi:hypothetical protein
LPQRFVMQAGSRSALIPRLAVISIAGQLIWIAIVVVGGLLEPGYSEIRDAVSVLGARNAAHPWLFDVAVAIWVPRSSRPRWRWRLTGHVAGEDGQARR